MDNPWVNTLNLMGDPWATPGRPMGGTVYRLHQTLTMCVAGKYVYACHFAIGWLLLYVLSSGGWRNIKLELTTDSTYFHTRRVST